MENIKNIDIFKQLNSNELTEVFDKIHYQKKKFSKNDVIALKGEQCDYLKIILKGSVHTEMSELGDKIIKIADLKAGQTIAIAFLFGTRNFIPVSVIADEETIKEKILFFLNEQKKIQKSNTINLNLTQQKLAELFGVTRPSLARSLKDLEIENKIMHISRTQIQIIE